jgi:hypothetical protein
MDRDEKQGLDVSLGRSRDMSRSSELRSAVLNVNAVAVQQRRLSDRSRWSLPAPSSGIPVDKSGGKSIIGTTAVEVTRPEQAAIA